MEKTISVKKARDELSTIVDEVQFQGDKYVVHRHGKPAVAIVPIHIYENWKNQRSRLIEIMEEVHAANPDVDLDEVMRDVLEAQQAVRVQQEKGDKQRTNRENKLSQLQHSSRRARGSASQKAEPPTHNNPTGENTQHPQQQSAKIRSFNKSAKPIKKSAQICCIRVICVPILTYLNPIIQQELVGMRP
jgi:prevent-host-death family protein